MIHHHTAASGANVMQVPRRIQITPSQKKKRETDNKFATSLLRTGFWIEGVGLSEFIREILVPLLFQQAPKLAAGTSCPGGGAGSRLR